MHVKLALDIILSVILVWRLMHRVSTRPPRGHYFRRIDRHADRIGGKFRRSTRVAVATRGRCRRDQKNGKCGSGGNPNSARPKCERFCSELRATCMAAK